MVRQGLTNVERLDLLEREARRRKSEGLASEPIRMPANTAQSVASGAVVPLTVFDSANVPAGVVSTTSGLIIPAAGFWTVEAGAKWSSGVSGVRRLWVSFGGAVVFGGIEVSGESAGVSLVRASTREWLPSGTVLGVSVSQTSGGSLSVTAGPGTYLKVTAG